MFLKSFFITLHYSFYKRYFLRCFLYSTVNFTTNNAHCQIAQSVERLQCVAVMESNASSTPSNDVHKRADSYKVRKYQNTKSKTMETQEHRSLRVTNYPFVKLILRCFCLKLMAPSSLFYQHYSFSYHRCFDFYILYVTLN